MEKTVIGRRSRRQPPVASSLVAEITEALTRVDAARSELDRVLASPAPLPDRRHAHAGLRTAFREADALLRAAVWSARAHSYGEGSRWRQRLSTLDAARQRHLFQEADDSGVLPLNSVRAVDTGMGGPAIGDLMHGKASPAGTPARYGLDVREALGWLDQRRAATGASTGPVSHSTTSRARQPAG